MAPTFIKFWKQDTDYDCGIACLAMILHLPPAEVHAVAGKTLKKWPDATGLTTRRLQTVARALGAPLTSKDPPKDYSNQTGILLVGGKKGYHFVVIFEGIVAEPTFGDLWNIDTYLKTYKVRPVRFLQP